MNTISFKIEENYSYTTDRGQVIESIRPVVGISGKTIVSAINFANRGRDELQTKVLDKVTTTTYIINDTTDNLISSNFTTDYNGYVNIDLSKMLTNNTFIKFYQKYKAQITLNVTIEIPKTDTYNVFVDNTKITPTWNQESAEIEFDDYDYYDNDDTILLSPLSDKVTNLSTLRQTYKTVEDNYLLVKKQYESQTIGNVDLKIDRAETYEPADFKTVITRLLEFQVGTLQPAIDYTKTVKLTTDYETLYTINNLVNFLANKYPNITIDDGEGIPYDVTGDAEAGIGADNGIVATDS